MLIPADVSILNGVNSGKESTALVSLACIPVTIGCPFVGLGGLATSMIYRDRGFIWFVNTYALSRAEQFLIQNSIADWLTGVYIFPHPRIADHNRAVDDDVGNTCGRE